MTDDREFEQILARASRPPVPAHGAADIMARIGEQAGHGTVVAFPAAHRRAPWGALGALAASLALGILLGASGLAEPFFSGDAMAGMDGPADVFGEDDEAGGEIS